LTTTEAPSAASEAAIAAPMPLDGPRDDRDFSVQLAHGDYSAACSAPWPAIRFWQVLASDRRGTSTRLMFAIVLQKQKRAIERKSAETLLSRPS
jgi:hypothetical protein